LAGGSVKPSVILGKGLFRLARVLRLASVLVAGLTALALIASPFVASSFANWVGIAGVSLGAAVGAYLILYRGVPGLLARWAVAVLPAEQAGYARAELAIWEHENRHGPAPGALRREFHEQFDAGEGAQWHPNRG
jgi:Ca2+/Na+ antiporter